MNFTLSGALLPNERSELLRWTAAIFVGNGSAQSFHHGFFRKRIWTNHANAALYRTGHRIWNLADSRFYIFYKLTLLVSPNLV